MEIRKYEMLHVKQRTENTILKKGREWEGKVEWDHRLK